MPRDTDGGFKGYPETKDLLMKNPFPKSKSKPSKKFRARRFSKISTNATDLPRTLQHNEKFEYRPSHVGNFPLLTDGVPKSGVWRIMLPDCADWSDPKPIEKKKKEPRFSLLKKGD